MPSSAQWLRLQAFLQHGIQHLHESDCCVLCGTHQCPEADIIRGEGISTSAGACWGSAELARVDGALGTACCSTICLAFMLKAALFCLYSAACNAEDLSWAEWRRTPEISLCTQCGYASDSVSLKDLFADSSAFLPFIPPTSLALLHCTVQQESSPHQSLGRHQDLDLQGGAQCLPTLC